MSISEACQAALPLRIQTELELGFTFIDQLTQQTFDRIGVFDTFCNFVGARWVGLVLVQEGYPDASDVHQQEIICINRDLTTFESSLLQGYSGSATTITGLTSLKLAKSLLRKQWCGKLCVGSARMGLPFRSVPYVITVLHLELSKPM